MNRRAPSPAFARLVGALAVVAFATSLPGVALASPEAETPAVPTEAEQAASAGEAAARRGEHEGALEQYERARELDPELDVDEPLALAHFQIGTQAYADGKYEDALAHFQDAQGLYSSPNFHYNIAQCYEALERPQQAIDSYRAFLRAVADTPDRANIENKIARLQKRANETPRDENTGPEATDPKPLPSPQVDEPRLPGRGLIVTGSVLSSLGVAVAIGGGIASGIRAADRARRVDDVFEAGNPGGLTRAETEALDAQGRRAETAQIIMLAAGGAVATVGVVLLAVGLVERKRGRQTVATVPAAMFGRGVAGLSFMRSF